MLRIYLDKNIFSYIRKKEQPHHVLLAEKLEFLEPVTVLPYSTAHMGDLKNGYDTEDQYKIDKLNEDLTFISKITHDHYLQLSFKEPNPIATIRSPFEAFKTQIETEPVEMLSDPLQFLENSFDENEPHGKAAKEAIAALRNLPNISGNLSEMDGIGIIGNMFKGDTFGEQMKNASELFNSINSNTKEYKDLSNLAKKGIPLGDLFSIKSDAVTKLNERMKNSPLNKTFDELTDTVLTGYKKDAEITNWDRFSANFSTLNLIGYFPDKLTNGVENYHFDLQHAFFAAHCDFFITDDERTSYKAKASYENLGIQTKVCTVKEFLEEIEKYDFKFNFTNDFLSSAKAQTSGLPLLHYSAIETKQEVSVWNLEKKCFNYFDKYILVKSQDGSWWIHFQKSRENYSYFTFMSEIDKLVELFVRNLGNDIFGAGSFDYRKEANEVRQGTWKGRYWSIDAFILRFHSPSEEYYPVLTLSQLPKESGI